MRTFLKVQSEFSVQGPIKKKFSWTTIIKTIYGPARSECSSCRVWFENYSSQPKKCSCWKSVFQWIQIVRVCSLTIGNSYRCWMCRDRHTNWTVSNTDYMTSPSPLRNKSIVQFPEYNPRYRKSRNTAISKIS